MREGANAQLKLGQLGYNRDIKAYLTEFRALNIYTRRMGESLQEKFDQAISYNILEIRFCQNPDEFIDDEHFLCATYQADLHVQKLKVLKASKEAPSGGSHGLRPGSGGKKDGQKEKNPGNP